MLNKKFEVYKYILQMLRICSIVFVIIAFFIISIPFLLKGDLVAKGEKRNEGVGLIEAHRGTLFHHYKINEKDSLPWQI